MEKLQDVIQINPQELEPLFQQAQELLHSKRWFELGNKVQEILDREDLLGKRLYIYQNFVTLYAEALDKLRYAYILLSVSDEMQTHTALEFLSEMLEKFKDKNCEPALLIRMRMVLNHTQNGEFEVALNQLHEIEQQITEDTDNKIRSMFHKTQADLDKARGDFDGFYQHALFYLSTSRETDNHVLAYDLCMAALFSVKVCSFGQIAAHKILDSLKDTPNDWLRSLILLLDSGESDTIPEFNEKFAPIIMANDVFKSYISVIQQKLALSVFLQLIFARPFDSRIFDFQEISTACHVPLESVELLVMKALSTELIRGEIDEVAQKLVVTWCKPKTIGKERLIHLKSEIDRWNAIVSNQMEALQTKSQPVVG
jgi:26S proteasome regulatory subunit N9